MAFDIPGLADYIARQHLVGGTMPLRDQVVDKRVIERAIRRGPLIGQQLVEHLATDVESTQRSEWVTVTVEGRRTPAPPATRDDS